jgi:hypothetical protein
MIPEPLQFDGNDLNKLLLKDPALKLVFVVEKLAPNHFGTYHNMYQPDDVNRSLHCYYLCDPDGNECIKSPPVGMAWYATVPQLIEEIQALLKSVTAEQRTKSASRRCD